ncbi:CLAVATA3/ESR (CLE)-related protein 43-like [Raphanus sativus]|uniref:CLAVATA3/ESR (CLE)-related protein 43-like n=1 Tax=Raphanus sativus TaxID=3726 RepID=A0A6J0NXB1_RAPSA|nr:CLAVATA3/ESR (CLE)-related protein 43-like [Raphanus sativus]
MKFYEYNTLTFFLSYHRQISHVPFSSSKPLSISSSAPSLYCMGCRDILLTFSVALLLISLFQIWLFREGQLRERSEDSQVGKDGNTLASKNKKDDDVQRLFQRYFKDLNDSNRRFEDSYRQIPSSPDRLHN